MGYLKTAGAPVSFETLQKIKAYIKKHGIIQFINLFHHYRSQFLPATESYKWGDETEHHAIYYDHSAQEAKVLANAEELMTPFNESKDGAVAHLQPEYGGWMLEAISNEPFVGHSLSTLAQLDSYYRKRRVAISQFLSSFGPLSISNIPSFPLLGTGDYAIRLPQLHAELAKLQSPLPSPSEHGGESKVEEEKKEEVERRDSDQAQEEAKSSATSTPEKPTMSVDDNRHSTSLFTFDAAINSHPRFPTLSRHIRERRGEKVCIKVPMYIDTHTQLPEKPTVQDPFPGSIYMDSMAFGMGCCCLQLTYQAQSMDHARYLHDQLLVLGPILSALSASAPIYRGRLADIDLRFTVIAQSVDDRTPEERDSSSAHFIPKSRYSHNSHYISNHASVMAHHNDTLPLEVNPEYMEMLKNAGVDERLAYHIASLFVRDPLVVYEKGIEVDDQATTAHFENFQSTNWNSIRFKPPPSLDSPIGWRVEFRPMDLQLTDYENAAMTALTTLLVKLLNKFNVNFIIPISMGDENMERAHTRDAIHREKFHFRKNIIDGPDYAKNSLEKTGFLASNLERTAEKEDVEEMTLAEILEGKSASGYKGIFPLLEELINAEAAPETDKERVRGYLRFLAGRARGEYRTGAKYIRDYVMAHPEYRHDSVITPKINYDLLRHLESVNAAGVDPRVLYAVGEFKAETEARCGPLKAETCISMACCQ